MKQLFAILFILLFSFGFGQRNAQERAENAVKKHLKNTFKEKYKSYGFETLYKVSPPRITEVENLKYKIDVLRKNNMLTDSSLKYYDSIIKLKVDTIKANKEYSTYDISHYYVIKDEGKNFLYYTQFFLTPDGKIKDVTQKMKFEFVGKEYDWFYNYYRRNPMFPENSTENKNAFLYLDNILKESENKEAAMATVIHTYSVISKKRYMDTVEIPKILALHWLKKNNTEPLIIEKFSEIKTISDNNEKIGYNLFILYQKQGKMYAQYFEYNTNFVLTGSLPVEKPFEKYFNKKD